MINALIRTGNLFRIGSENRISVGRNIHLVVKDSEQCRSHVEERWRFASLQRDRRRTKDPALVEQRKQLVFHYDELVEEIGELKQRSHKEGLLGEILADLTLDDCFPPLDMKYVNYYRTGTPNVAGIDIAGLIGTNKDDWLVLLESKFTEQGTTETIRLKNEALASISERCESEANFANVVLQILPNAPTDAARSQQVLIQRMINAYKRDCIVGCAYICSSSAEANTTHFIQSSPLTQYNIADYLSTILRLDSEPGIVRFLD